MWTVYHRIPPGSKGVWAGLLIDFVGQVEHHARIDHIRVFDLIHFLDELDVIIAVIKLFADSGQSIALPDFILPDYRICRDFRFRTA